MINKFKLKNGLSVLLAPLKETKAVTVLVLLPVGSRYETKDINGVSHFVEHLMFKGTKKRPTALALSRELDSVGAEFNAFTGKDHTGYYIKVPANKIELAFDMLSDMLFDSLFPAVEIEKERGVIIEEINMYQDNPLMFAPDLFERTVFRGHQLGQEIAGPRKVIATVPRSKILKYKNRFYEPANMVVSVAGQMKEDRVKKLAQQYFGRKQKIQTPSRFKKFKVTQSQPRISLHYKESQQVQLCLGFPAFAIDNPKIYPLYLLSVILGGNMSSRLFTSVREQHGLAYFVRASVQTYQDTGAFLIQAGLDKKRLNQAIGLILAELKKIKAEGVSMGELNDAKEFLRGKLILDLEDSEHVADWYGKQQMFLDKISSPEQKIKKILAVKQDDIKKIANEIMIQQRINLAMIGPFKDQAPFKKLLKI